MKIPRQPPKLSRKGANFWGWGIFAPFFPQKIFFLTLQKNVKQKSPTSTFMRLFTLISIVVSDFSQVPPIPGKLILFISVLKPIFGKSRLILIDFNCILLPLAHDLMHKKEIQGFGIQMCASGSAKTHYLRSKVQNVVIPMRSKQSIM